MRFSAMSFMARCIRIAPALLIVTTASAQVDPASRSYNELVLAGESGGNQYATTPLGSATGTYQFTYATLKDLGYISSGPSGVPAGAGEWEGVQWTGLDGVTSRESFMANQAAQDAALSRLTERNWSSIASSTPLGETVNGVPMTEGGALYATHMMGAGGYREWASCGFQPACLDPAQAAANNMTVEEYQAHLMKRVAEGAGVDPSNIEAAAFAELGADDAPGASLMPWRPANGPAVIAFTR